MTRIEQARQGQVSDEIRQTAAAEGLSPETLCERLAAGEVVITRNTRHTQAPPLAIGRGCSIKVNANIGTSRDVLDVEGEISKAKAAVAAGAHTIMDLSTGAIWRTSVAKSCRPPRYP